MARLWKGCVNLFYSQVSRDKLPVYELNKGTLVYSQAEGQGPLRQISMIVITEATKSKSKKQFQHGVRIGFLLAAEICIYLFSYLLFFFTPGCKLCKNRYIFLICSLKYPQILKHCKAESRLFQYLLGKWMILKHSCKQRTQQFKKEQLMHY